MEFFLISIFIIAALLSFFKPVVGLYAFFVTAYIRPQDFYPIFVSLQPARWILVITFISFLLHKLLSREKWTTAKQNWAILGIFSFILLSKISVINGVMWWAAAEDFIRVLLVYFMLINILNTSKKLRNFIIFFIILNAIIAFRFYYAYKFGSAIYHGSKPGDATFGFLANADDLGLGMVIALAYVIIPVFYVKSKVLKGVCAFSGGLFMMAALATQSRGALIGIFTVFIVSIVSQFKSEKLKKNKFRIGICIVLIMLSLFVYKFRYALEDSYQSVQDERDTGRVGRMATWDAAKRMIKDKPLTGVGRGNFVSYWKANYPAGVYGYQVAHNIIYEVAAEIGFLGLFCFLVFSLSGLKEIRKLRKKYSTKLKNKDFLDMIFTIYTIGVIGFYVNGMFITVAFYWHIYVLVAIYVSAKNILLKEIAYEKIPAKK